MKKEELIFTKDESKNEWIKACIFNKGIASAYDKALDILEKVENTDQFVTAFIHCEELSATQGYAELAKWGEFRDLERTAFDFMYKNATKVFCALSDAGGVLLKNRQLAIRIPNGYGDGNTTVYIFAKADTPKFNDSLFRYFTIINGSADILQYDCDENSDVVYSLKGKYRIYNGYGKVFFVEV